MSRSSCRGYVPPDYKLKWEEVAKELDRVPVDGGFIYRTIAGSYSAPAMVFVPTPPKVVSIPNPPGGVMVRGDRQVARGVLTKAETAVMGFCGWCTDPEACKPAGRCMHNKEPIPPGMSCGGVHVTPLDRDGKPEDLGRCNALGCNAPAVNKLDGGWRFCAFHTRKNTTPSDARAEHKARVIHDGNATMETDRFTAADRPASMEERERCIALAVKTGIACQPMANTNDPYCAICNLGPCSGGPRKEPR